MVWVVEVGCGLCNAYKIVKWNKLDSKYHLTWADVPDDAHEQFGDSMCATCEIDHSQLYSSMVPCNEIVYLLPGGGLRVS